MPKTYVNNAYNRSVGRVGMVHGSAVISSGSSGGSSRQSSYTGNSASYSSGSTSSSNRTYVDNAFNRSVDRVGLKVGTMVISKEDKTPTQSSYHSNDKTYVDNAFNRRAGRVGLEVGAMVISKEDKTPTQSSHNINDKTYVDNAFNRRAGRVGLEVGTMVISKSNDISTQSNYQSNEKTYADNAFNRKADRVGLEIGTKIISKKDESKYSSADKQKIKEKKPEDKKTRSETAIKNRSKSEKVYVENALNRRLGRVGLPLGSKPLRRKVKATEDHIRSLMTLTYPQSYDFSERDHNFCREYDFSERDHNFCREYEQKLEEMVQNLMDRRAAENNLVLESQDLNSIHTLQSFATISGKDIAYEEVELIKKIGSGGFGEVYLSKWNGTIVAVKKLRLQRISKNRLKDFTKEVTNYYTLNHPNVVKFLGACTVTPNLCIIMEYMDMSLFEAKIDIDFTENERLQIISDVCKGLLYLHEKGIAHCDLKTQNILIRYKNEENVCVAKICDFGLSIIKHNAETSGSSIEQHFKNIGTPRYSAPEVLRGELIAASAWFMCDVYSLSLIIFEIVYEEEPFDNLSYVQLQKQVGENGLTPDIPAEVIVDINIYNLMKSCWKFNPVQRPKIYEIEKKVNQLSRVYGD